MTFDAFTYVAWKQTTLDVLCTFGFQVKVPITGDPFVPPVCVNVGAPVCPVAGVLGSGDRLIVPVYPAVAGLIDAVTTNEVWTLTGKERSVNGVLTIAEGAPTTGSWAWKMTSSGTS